MDQWENLFFKYLFLVFVKNKAVLIVLVCSTSLGVRGAFARDRLRYSLRLSASAGDALNLPQGVIFFAAFAAWRETASEKDKQNLFSCRVDELPRCRQFTDAQK